MIKLFLEEIRYTPENSNQVKFSRFGNFDLRNTNQRLGRNPKTGKGIPITVHLAVTFRPD